MIGEYPVSNTAEIKAIFEPLWRKHGGELNPPQFVGRVYELHPYYNGPCTCGYTEKEDLWIVQHEKMKKRDRDQAWADFAKRHDHLPECREGQANFIYKPTNYEIHWSHSPFKGAWANQQLTLDQFRIIIDKCLEAK